MKFTDFEFICLSLITTAAAWICHGLVIRLCHP